MASTRSQQTSRTQSSQYSELAITGRDPAFDYSFRRKIDVENGGGMDSKGYEPVGEDNWKGETWDGPRAMQTRTKGRKNMVYEDTVLCKRPKETSQFFQRLEDEKYNAQCRLVKTAAQTADVKLRELDPGAVIVDRSTGLDKAMPQRSGPTQEA